MAVDPNDPCAVAAYLKTVLMARIAGESEAMIRTKTGETEQEVRFHAPMALADLRAEIERQDQLCAIANGTSIKPKRFAITAGSRRSC